MLLKDDSRKKGVVALILKKMKGGDSYDSMKSDNEGLSEQMMHKPMHEGAEQDYNMGYDACCEEMLAGFEQKDPKRLKMGLKSFVKMMFNELESKEDDEKHMY